jgi:hypothetical protein
MKYLCKKQNTVIITLIPGPQLPVKIRLPYILQDKSGGVLIFGGQTGQIFCNLCSRPLARRDLIITKGSCFIINTDHPSGQTWPGCVPI